MRSAFSTLAALLTVLSACGDPVAPLSEAGPPAARIYAGLPDRPMTLDVSQIAPGETGGYRVVGGLRYQSVTVYQGNVGGQTCPQAFGGTCLSLGNAKPVGAAAGDLEGNMFLQGTVSSNVTVGKTFAYQAITTDPKTGISHVSNRVKRTVLDPATLTPPPATNVLVILVDDVGVDRLGLYGATDPVSTPALDALAAEGLVFENAWSQALCAPTRAALQTGRLPRRTGWHVNPASDSELDPALTTIAELVEHSPSAVYSTSYIGKWHLSTLVSETNTLNPVVQGWDHVAATLESIDNFFLWKKIDTSGNSWLSPFYATTENVDDALDQIGVMPEPWLMQVSFNSAHEPYHVPPMDLHTNAGLTDASPLSEKERAMIESADLEMGRLLDGIPADVRARTTVIFLADNGTPPLVLEDELAPTPDRAKGTLYDGGVRVPMVVSGPLVGAPGTRTAAFAHVVDLFPTIAEIAGVDVDVLRGAVDPAQTLALDGFSLVSAFADPASLGPRDLLYTDYCRPHGPGPYSHDSRAIRDQQYKLIVNALCGTEMFFEYVPGAVDEGPDLLLAGALTLEQEDARDRLRDQMDAMVADMAYDEAHLLPVVAKLAVCP